MDNIEYVAWFINVVQAANEDRKTGKRRFGNDFPMKKIPKTFNGQGVSNFAAQVYNAAYEGWE